MTKLSERLEALADKATKGPWEWDADPKFSAIKAEREMVAYYTVWDDGIHFASEGDPFLIVELVNNLPTIIEALKAKDL